MTEPEAAVPHTGLFDGVRRVAHAVHEARLAKTLAEDALDNAAHATTQTMKTWKRRMQALADRRYDFEHQVRREPFKSVGIALGAGILVGAVAGALCAVRMRSKKELHL
jgi:ElaB/YqjD/DUF883 family membrane-anchored ribosome-binding protein